MLPIIRSVLWTDLQLLLTSQLIHKFYPKVKQRSVFINRDNLPMPHGFADAVKEQIEMLSLLGLTRRERERLGSLGEHHAWDNIPSSPPYFEKDYIDWLDRFRFDPREVTITQDNYGNLSASFEANSDRAVLWETPFLAIVTALYYKMMNIQPSPDYIDKAIAKRALFASAGYPSAGLDVSDFGTRRAFSPEVMTNVIAALSSSSYVKKHGNGVVSYPIINSDWQLRKTSNVSIAINGYNVEGYSGGKLIAVGTYGHPLVMLHAALEGVTLSNQAAMYNWLRMYGDRNGLRTSVTDTYTTPFYLRVLSKEYANEFKTYRIDSGDPIKVGEMICHHLTKSRDGSVLSSNLSWFNLLPSDALTGEMAVEISNHFSRKIHTPFGIGGWLMNDVDAPRVNFVVKPTEFWIPYRNPHMVQDADGWVQVCKLSDSPGKYSGSEAAIKNALEAIGYV